MHASSSGKNDTRGADCCGRSAQDRTHSDRWRRRWALAAAAVFWTTPAIWLDSYPGDYTVFRGLSGLGGPAVSVAMQVVSWIGDPLPIAVAGPTLIFFFWWARRGVVAATLAVGLTLMAAGPLLKVVVMRPRPGLDCMTMGCGLADLGFPSGHALRAVIFLGLLAFGSEHLSSDARWRIAIRILAVTAATMVGLSRIVLGAHWFSDVVGGWLWGVFLTAVALQIGRFGMRFRTAPSAKDDVKGHQATGG